MLTSLVGVLHDEVVELVEVNNAVVVQVQHREESPQLFLVGLDCEFSANASQLHERESSLHRGIELEVQLAKRVFLLRPVGHRNEALSYESEQTQVLLESDLVLAVLLQVPP